MVKKEEVVALMKSVGITDEQIEALEKRGYFHAPASKNKHLAVEGGLMQHSYNVALRLCETRGTRLNTTWASGISGRNTSRANTEAQSGFILKQSWRRISLTGGQAR